MKHHSEFMEGEETNNPRGNIGDLDIPEELQISPCGSPSPGATLFILKAKEERRVTQRALDGLLELS